jgi:hypothetical protein
VIKINLDFIKNIIQTIKKVLWLIKTNQTAIIKSYITFSIIIVPGIGLLILKYHNIMNLFITATIIYILGLILYSFTLPQTTNKDQQKELNTTNNTSQEVK